MNHQTKRFLEPLKIGDRVRVMIHRAGKWTWEDATVLRRRDEEGLIDVLAGRKVIARQPCELERT